MTESALMAVELASTNWQMSMNQNQITTATTVNQAATLLMDIYTKAQDLLDGLMKPMKDEDYNKDNYNPADGKPPADTAGDGTIYSTNVNIWETYYNEQSQNCQNTENGVNTPIQALDQQESSLGNAAQEASQIASTVAQPNHIVASLLQSAL